MERKRCPNKSRRNKKTGLCEPYSNPKTKKKATEIIQRFMKKTKHARISNFLNTVCEDSGICIAFGKEGKKIREFFGNFDLSYATDHVRRLSDSLYSKNGFVSEIYFTHKGYSSYAVLKSATFNYSDNLMYEYRVGQFLNKMSLLYPCFIETYKLFKYNSVSSFNYVKSHPDISTAMLKTHITPQDYDLTRACKTPRFNSILVQHLKASVTMFKFINSIGQSLNYNFLLQLFQVYFVLDQMKDIFTHYDLHANNVMIYRPSVEQYIHFHYHLDTEILSFKTMYVAKIIDYGRCYFKDDNYSSKDFINEICAKKECNTTKTGRCGKKVGFTWLSPPVNYHIDSTKPNQSHDLNFLDHVLDTIRYKNSSILLPWFRLCIEQLHSEIIYQGRGTPEKIYCPFKICKVSDVCPRILAMLKNVSLDAMFDTYYPSVTKYGDMHVYSDGTPLQFIKA